MSCCPFMHGFTLRSSSEPQQRQIHHSHHPLLNNQFENSPNSYASSLMIIHSITNFNNDNNNNNNSTSSTALSCNTPSCIVPLILVPCGLVFIFCVIPISAYLAHFTVANSHDGCDFAKWMFRKNHNNNNTTGTTDTQQEEIVQNNVNPHEGHDDENFSNMQDATNAVVYYERRTSHDERHV
ncbi:hypothetical protein C9374_012163 [Naegleria lovaniensis]|uniref:Uncharacterized protein n=1 Tax=Naegleria lovaniensis TaxID=51637 RepID=A0AA88GF36_NAELO|nr:uncharacterized protein C9374_012163 [Naegleria lovaniensis]KAG2373424.1 hypothetical protein C9374_012163 [Naegleria lovaniensis]